MRIALIGLSNSGKTTVFNALTGLALETTRYASVSGDPHIAVVKVPDSRVDELARLYHPKKTTYATVEYVDYLGLTKGDTEQNRKVFEVIKDSDALVHVIRGFHDESVSHPHGTTDPVRDVKIVEEELIFHDLELVEKRLQRMEEGIKRGKKADDAEKRVLLKCKEMLEQEVPLRAVSFQEEEIRSMRHLQFMSVLPMIAVLNISEEDIKSPSYDAIMPRIEGVLFHHSQSKSTPPVTVSGKIEMEIAQLPPDEAADFLADLGVNEPAMSKLINVSYRLLGLISFFTVGEDEVRAWTVRAGTSAQASAGKIHSDIERGFIRAEVISYDDFRQSGSMASARQHGLLRLEGKTYIVRDGDIINFRFNV